jgi:hypothetical protein
VVRSGESGSQLLTAGSPGGLAVSPESWSNPVCKIRHCGQLVALSVEPDGLG